MFARHVLEVLYSPVKAFGKIVEKPDVKGPLLILVLVLLATTGAQYVIASRLFLQARTPANDEWTEAPEFLSLWTSDGIVSTSEDRIVGNYSVESSSNKTTHISLKLANVGPFNISGNTGFEGLSFRIKWIHENEIFPSSNATLHLLSNTESRYFEFNLISNISESGNEWANLTISLEADNHWAPINSPSWEAITGLEFILGWSAGDSANATMKIDDLFFLRYVSFLETDSFGNLVFNSLIDAALVFFINWAIYAGVLLVTVRLFQENTGPWKPFFILVGYVFVVNVIYILASAASLATLPTLKLPMKTWPPATAEELRALQVLIQENWQSATMYQFGVYLPFVVDGWIALLLAVAIRSLCGTSWKKAVGIAVVASLISFFIRTLFI